MSALVKASIFLSVGYGVLTGQAAYKSFNDYSTGTDMLVTFQNACFNGKRYNGEDLSLAWRIAGCAMVPGAALGVKTAQFTSAPTPK